MQQDRLLRLADIVGSKPTANDPGTPAIVPVSKAHIWAMVRTGQFPSPMKIGPRVTMWRLSAVNAWIAGHVSAHAQAA